MSLESWKEEFYIIEANSPNLKTKALRLEHSLQKWIGLLDMNLEKHNVNSFDITCRGTTTCSMCQNYRCSDCSLRGCVNFLGDPSKMVEFIAKALDKELSCH